MNKNLNNSEPPVNNSFLLGAGFTKAVFPDAPLNRDLLPLMCKNAPSITTTLKNYYKEHNKTTDIEILLTRLDLEITFPKAKKQTALQTVRRAVEEKLAESFQRFRFEEKLIENPWLKSFVRLFNENDAIITVNYDCLLDGLLDYYKIWCPSTGYGDVKVEVPGTSLDSLQNPKNILIYKIHGSENFQTCGINDGRIDSRHISLVVNEEIYPNSGKNRNFGVVQGQSYIIAPSFVKTFYPQIERMMIGALQAAKKAKNFVIIGCGLRPEDSFLWLLLTAFLYRSENGKIIIVDPDAERIKDKICEHYSDSNKHITTICRNLECSVDELISKLQDTCL